ncbi:MAG: hypothetical protein ACRC7R_10675 [Sarcina sp.]
MINLIKADLYRLFRSKTYKACIIASLGIIGFVLVLSIFTDVDLWIMAFTGKDGIRRGFLIGLEQGGIFNQFIINALSSGAGIYIVGICLTSASAISRYKSGVMKNTIPYGYERWKIYISQLVSLVIGISLLISMVFITILIITSVILTPTNISYKGVLIAIKGLLLNIVIVSSMVSIYLFLATLIVNSEVIAVIAMGEILGVTMLEPVIPSMINRFIPYSTIRTLAQVPESIDSIWVLLSAFIIITISIFLGILIFNKKEIK